jgi:membrane protein DedA with SNARE-associated domain
MPFGVFLASAIVARSLRFFAVAALLHFFGSPIRDFIERRLGLVFTLFLAILITGLLAVQLM